MWGCVGTAEEDGEEKNGGAVQEPPAPCSAGRWGYIPPPHGGTAGQTDRQADRQTTEHTARPGRASPGSWLSADANEEDASVLIESRGEGVPSTAGRVPAAVRRVVPC